MVVKSKCAILEYPEVLEPISASSCEHHLPPPADATDQCTSRRQEAKEEGGENRVKFFGIVHLLSNYQKSVTKNIKPKDLSRAESEWHLFKIVNLS